MNMVQNTVMNQTASVKDTESKFEAIASAIDSVNTIIGKIIKYLRVGIAEKNPITAIGER